MSPADRKEFLGRWIAYGMKQAKRAEALGIDWRQVSLERLDAEITFHEVFNSTQERRPTATQNADELNFNHLLNA